ncbi:MAG: hypothetical protein RJR37_00610 [Peptococcaceae bacterium MAG4]|nr:hypothetical protein [Peptococcaceae bacterium MAG4]
MVKGAILCTTARPLRSSSRARFGARHQGFLVFVQHEYHHIHSPSGDPLRGLLRARAGRSRASLLANVKEAFCVRRTARLHPRSLFNAAPQGKGLEKHPGV